MFKVIGKCMDPKTTLGKEMATVDPITITKDSSLEQALKIMRDKNLRRLIVVDDRGSPVGVLDQNVFFASLANVVLRAHFGESKTWMERYIHDIVDYNMA